MLSGEEKKAIENIKKEFEKNHILPDIANEDLGTLLNLIKKQSKEIEELIQRNKDLEQIEKEHKEENGRLREENKILRHGLEENTEEIDKLNVIINLMAEQLTTPVHSKKWVIDYFTNKVEEDK